jgi:hypothetical protein
MAPRLREIEACDARPRRVQLEQVEWPLFALSRLNFKRRARRLGAEIIEEPHFNPAPQHREIWLRDKDGYVVVVASPDGESGS